MGTKSNLSSRHFSSAFPNYSSFFVDNTSSKKINTAQVASLFMFLSEFHSKSWRTSWWNIQYKRDVKQLTLYVYWRNKRETTYFNARYHAVQWCRSVALIFFFFLLASVPDDDNRCKRKPRIPSKTLSFFYSLFIIAFDWIKVMKQKANALFSSCFRPNTRIVLYKRTHLNV